MSSNATAWCAVQFETNQRLQAQVDELQGQLPGRQGAAAPVNDDMAQQVGVAPARPRPGCRWAGPQG
jgi:hypothetical protein